MEVERQLATAFAAGGKEGEERFKEEQKLKRENKEKENRKLSNALIEKGKI